MTPEELDAIEARAKAVYLGSTGLGYAEAAEARPVVEADVPALVAEVRRLRAEVEGLRTAVLRVGVARDAARIAAGAHTLAHNALVERHRSGAPAEALEPLAIEHVRAEVVCRDAAQAMADAVDALLAPR